MKKNSLVKILLITFISVVFLSWIIPTGQYENGVFSSNGLNPTGIFDLVLIPFSVFDLALPSIIFILVVGAFYGVLNKTGVYSKLVDSVVKKFKESKLKFLVTVTIVMAILSALVGLNFGFFIIIPFISAILISMGFNKITSMLSTIGSILVGMVGSVYGTDIGYNFYKFFGYNSDYNMHSSLFPDAIIFLVIIISLLVLYVVKLGKADLKRKKDKDNEEEIMLLEKKTSKKSVKPLFALLIVTFVFILVGYFKWDAVIGGADKTPMLDFYNNIMGIKIGDFAIVSSLLGTIPALGYFELSFISVFVLFMTIIIALVYKVKFEDFAEGIMNGLSKVMKLVIYVILSNLVIACLYKNGSSSTFAATIINYLLNISVKFNSALTVFTSAVAGVLLNDFSTFMSNMYVPTRILTGSNVSVISLTFMIFKSIFGVVSMIAPTSVLLVTGLAYYNISFKEWFKNVWKLLLQLLVVIILIIVILTIFAFK